MLFVASCGHTPPACAWSPDEEERGKALFSYLPEGVAAVVWDNIPSGVGRPQALVVTATVITWRLKALVDAPVQVSDGVLVLQ